MPIQPVPSSVAVSNFPATQPVSGTVAITGDVNISELLQELRMIRMALQLLLVDHQISVDLQEVI
jgi:hypothetical protein